MIGIFLLLHGDPSLTIVLSFSPLSFPVFPFSFLSNSTPPLPICFLFFVSGFWHPRRYILRIITGASTILLASACHPSPTSGFFSSTLNWLLGPDKCSHPIPSPHSGLPPPPVRETILTLTLKHIHAAMGLWYSSSLLSSFLFITVPVLANISVLPTNSTTDLAWSNSARFRIQGSNPLNDLYLAPLTNYLVNLSSSQAHVRPSRIF